jgi:hypothetical protein
VPFEQADLDVNPHVIRSPWLRIQVHACSFVG